jgi:hypothetical protein
MSRKSAGHLALDLWMSHRGCAKEMGEEEKGRGAFLKAICIGSETPSFDLQVYVSN